MIAIGREIDEKKIKERKGMFTYYL